MSKQSIILCDICGAEIIGTRFDSAQIMLFSPGVYRGIGGQRIDLCIECYEKFVSFLDSGAKTDGGNEDG